MIKHNTPQYIFDRNILIFAFKNVRARCGLEEGSIQENLADSGIWTRDLRFTNWRTAPFLAIL